jgi:hypothetical protein
LVIYTIFLLTKVLLSPYSPVICIYVFFLATSTIINSFWEFWRNSKWHNMLQWVCSISMIIALVANSYEIFKESVGDCYIHSLLLETPIGDWFPIWK